MTSQFFLNIKAASGERFDVVKKRSMYFTLLYFTLLYSKVQWFLDVPVVLTLNSSTFSPHNVFMCLVWI